MDGHFQVVAKWTELHHKHYASVLNFSLSLYYKSSKFLQLRSASCSIRESKGVNLYL